MLQIFRDKSQSMFIQGVVLVIALVFVGVNFIVDIMYAFLDPRIRYN